MREPSENIENLMPTLADRAERALVGALLDCSQKKPHILATLGNGQCLRSASLRLIYSVCQEMQSEGAQPNAGSVADWLERRGRLEEAGGWSFLASLVADSAIDANVEQHCREVQRAYRGRQAQEAILGTLKKFASGGDSDCVTMELKDRLDQLSKDDHTTTLAVLSTSELLDQEVPSKKWLVEGIIPSNGFCMIAGESGVGKTWLLQELGLAVASGRSWLGKFATTKGKVLFIDEESGIALLKERLLKLGEPEDLRNLPIHFSVLAGLKIDTAEGREKLREAIKKTEASLVIIDSFVRIHSGEENSATDMSKVTEALSRMARELNCAIVPAHHARKKSLASNEPGQRLRGTSEIKAALDVHLFVTKCKNGAIRIEHEKARFGKTLEPMLVQLQEDAEGRIQLTCSQESVVKAEDAGRVIEGCLRGRDPDEWVFRRDLEAACEEEGISKRIFAEKLKQMVAEGKLEKCKQSQPTEKGGTRTLNAYRWKRAVLQ